MPQKFSTWHAIVITLAEMTGVLKKFHEGHNGVLIWGMDFNIFVEKFFLITGEDRGKMILRDSSFVFLLRNVHRMKAVLPPSLLLPDRISVLRERPEEGVISWQSCYLSGKPLFPLLHFQLYFVKTTVWSDHWTILQLFLRLETGCFPWSQLCLEQVPREIFVK